VCLSLLISSDNAQAVYDYGSCVAGGLISSVPKRKSPALQQDGNSEGGKRMKYLPILPEVCDKMLMTEELCCN
jgi:hypothetical protein